MSFELLKGLRKPYREYGGATNKKVVQPTIGGKPFSATRYGSVVDKPKVGYKTATSFNKPIDHPISKTPTFNHNAKPLAHPVSHPNAHPLAHPQRNMPGDQRVGTGRGGAIPATSLAHPQRRMSGDQRVGTGNNRGTQAIAEAIRPKPRTAKLVTTKSGGSTRTVAGKPVAVSSASPKAAKQGLGARLKKALKGSRQQNQIKALQRQHRAARKGTSAEVRTQTHR